jgi:hypothetical protein
VDKNLFTHVFPHIKSPIGDFMCGKTCVKRFLSTHTGRNLFSCVLKHGLTHPMYGAQKIFKDLGRKKLTVTFTGRKSILAH